MNSISPEDSKLAAPHKNCDIFHANSCHLLLTGDDTPGYNTTMHELSVTENLLEITLRHAEQAGARRVTDLNIVVGQLASIVDDSVQFYWDIISENTPAQGAALHFRRIPAELLCLDCGKRYAPSGDEFACPQCASLRARIAAGEEFYLDSIEVE